jgi:hypothetical protein
MNSMISCHGASPYVPSYGFYIKKKRPNLPTGVVNSREVAFEMRSLHGICAQQRVRRDLMVVKCKALQGVLKRIQVTSKSAILFLKELQFLHEECLSTGSVVCSKVQHSVADCDPGSLAVAGSVAAIDLASVSVARAGAEVVRVCGLITAMQDGFKDVSAQQRETQDDLYAMCNAHSCATDIHAVALADIEKGLGCDPASGCDVSDVHAQALAALEKGLGYETGSGLKCANCMEDAQAVYAARTGMCKTCHEKTTADALNSGWERCVQMEDAI